MESDSQTADRVEAEGIPQDEDVCATCRSPGACCKHIPLTLMVSFEGWRERAQAVLDTNALYMLHPERVHPVPEFGDTHRVIFSCSFLTPEGRCGEYEKRPDLCRGFIPKSDPLCAEYIRTLRGIPIVFKPT